MTPKIARRVEKSQRPTTTPLSLASNDSVSCLAHTIGLNIEASNTYVRALLIFPRARHLLALMRIDRSRTGWSWCWSPCQAYCHTLAVQPCRNEPITSTLLPVAIICDTGYCPCDGSQTGELAGRFCHFTRSRSLALRM